MKDFADFKNKFNYSINNYLDNKIKWAKTIDSKSAFLIKIIKEFINRGGKRLRPAIFYFAYKSYSQTKLDNILLLSSVFELFHTFALIHDDIIDQSDQRRGKKTIHKQYNLATAILTGDLALILADEIFSTQIENMQLKNKQKIIEIYNEYKQEIILGQYLDYIKAKDILKIMKLKTANYSFVKPALIGLSIAGVDNYQINKWKDILTEIGILFQLKDDYLGTFSDEKIIGKPITTDFIEGKNTLIVQYFKQIATKKELNHFLSVFGKNQSAIENLQWFKDILIKRKIDKKIQSFILSKSDVILNELNQNFKSILLRDLITKILLQIRNFSCV